MRGALYLLVPAALLAASIVLATAPARTPCDPLSALPDLRCAR